MFKTAWPVTLLTPTSKPRTTAMVQRKHALCSGTVMATTSTHDAQCRLVYPQGNHNHLQLRVGFMTRRAFIPRMPALFVLMTLLIRTGHHRYLYPELRLPHELQRYAVVLDHRLIGCLVRYRGCRGPLLV